MLVVPPQEIQRVAGPHVVQLERWTSRNGYNSFAGSTSTSAVSYRWRKPPGGHLSDLVQRAVAEQADRLRVADQPILLGLVEFFDVHLEVVLQARQHNHGIGNGIGECGNRVDDLEEPFDGADWLAMSSSWSIKSTRGTSWTAAVNFASCCKVRIGSASSAARDCVADPLAVLGPHFLAPQPHQGPVVNPRLGPFQVQHHPEQSEVAVPEARGPVCSRSA